MSLQARLRKALGMSARRS